MTGLYPPTSFGSYPAPIYPSYGGGGGGGGVAGAGYPGQTLTPLAPYPGSSSSIYQNHYGLGSLPGSYAPNPYAPQGAYRPPSGGGNPTNLYNPSFSPSVGFNPSGTYNPGLYPTNSYNPVSSTFPYKPISPVVSGQNSYPNSAIIPDPFSFQGPSYNPSVGASYNPSSISSSYNPVSSQQPYKPIVIEGGYNPGSYGSSSYNSAPVSSQQYKPITVIDASYGSGSNRPSSSGTYEGYDSITITANPYGGGSSSYKPSYGSSAYKPSSNRPVIQASIQEIPNNGPLFYSNLKSDADSGLKDPAPSSSSQVAFPAD